MISPDRVIEITLLEGYINLWGILCTGQLVSMEQCELRRKEKRLRGIEVRYLWWRVTPNCLLMTRSRIIPDSEPDSNSPIQSY